MTDSHLANTIKMLERAWAVFQFQLPFPNFNGEMAQYYAEHDYDTIQQSGPEYSQPLYLDLCEEQERRKEEILQKA
jgi:hypothetical protein